MSQNTPALPRSTPEQQGIDSSVLLEFVTALENQCHEIHSFMLLRHGYVIAEGGWSPYATTRPHMLFSLSKSFTATAVGLAVAEGYFSINDPVLAFFPDAKPSGEAALWQALTVQHLLCMSTGHAEDTWTAMIAHPDGDWINAFFEVPLRFMPGTHFLYNTGATHMLAAIVQRTTGLTLLDYLQPRLLQPLSIANAAWEVSPQGIQVGGIGLSLNTEDIARFGQLYLQNGVWQGEQLIPQAWVSAATALQIATGDSDEGDWAQGYGYQFWRCQHNAYRGDGVFGQYCIVMPEQDAVLAMTGGLDVLEMQLPLTLLWEILLPAMASAPLPEAPDAYQNLTRVLADLKRLPVQGAATSPIAQQVSGQRYRVDANDLQIDLLSADFSDSGCTLLIGTATGEETLTCGYGRWQEGQTAAFKHTNRAYISSLQPLSTASASHYYAASGGWTTSDVFRLVVRLCETPFVYTLDLHFMENHLLVEIQINASLYRREPHLLTAQTL